MNYESAHGKIVLYQRETLSLLERTLTQQQLINELGTQVIRLISDYAKSWHLLLAYDEDKLTLPDIAKPSRIFLYEEARSAIQGISSLDTISSRKCAFAKRNINSLDC